MSDIATIRAARYSKLLAIRFDADTADEMLARAKRDGMSLSEQVRCLVEWGLESAKQAETKGAR